MSNKDDMLSQEEIDALLSGGQGDDSAESESSASNQSVQTDSPPLEDHFSTMEVDAIGELGNISFGSSATTLSTLLNQKVEITTPTVGMVGNHNLTDEFPTPHVAVIVDYTDGFEGFNLFIIKNHDAAIIADLMLGGDGTNPNEELGEIQLSAVQEAMNQMMGSAATSMSSVFNKKVDISPPKTLVFDVKTGEGMDYIPNEDHFVKASFQLKVGDLIDSSIMQLMPIDFTKDYVKQILTADSQEFADSVDDQGEASEPAPAKQQEAVEPQLQQSEAQALGSHKEQQDTLDSVESAQFSEFPRDASHVTSKEHRNLELLMDIPLNISVELGRTRKSIKEILELNTGSILELDKLAGEPVDILINNQLIAKGEVVVIDENFGVRVTDILNQSDRLKKLR
ncbi:flagellar motor switch phosphatase FliY [Tenuibacillus multivorans]|uniref:Flagellar motor switch protein FliN/FliY n=1 Tax=Tenuibacillus multivorans TaxID=237069 RepID=A0A1G9XYA6_9BACI|nr:flagellar motor switch phosphatase FliY [Tenuibacillus multivorans]GEL75868.1 flagellar motor switch phosphatase FliY [Tenuibacillus multivorans]SDN01734.1 flagellar motor switch protein FliN/FliY [Tenuibacillus multivorans]